MREQNPVANIVIDNAQHLLMGKKCRKRLVHRFTHYLSTRHNSLKGLHKLDYKEVERLLEIIAGAIKGGYGGNPQLLARLMREDMARANIIWTSRMAESLIEIYGDDEEVLAACIPHDVLTPEQVMRVFGTSSEHRAT